MHTHTRTHMMTVREKEIKVFEAMQHSTRTIGRIDCDWWAQHTKVSLYPE